MNLHEMRLAALADAKAIIDAAEAEENRSLTDEEKAAYDGHIQRAKELKDQIDRKAELDTLTADANTGTRRSAAEPPTGTVPAVVKDPKEEGMGGFRSLGEFAQTVYRSSLRGAQHDPRLELRTDTSTFANEASGVDGGFTVPDDIQTTVSSHVFNDTGIFSLTNQIPVNGNSLTAPRSETTPWGSTGITVAWTGEGSNITETKPVFGLDTIRASKLAALVPASEELLADSAVAIEAFIGKKTGEAMRYEIDDAIVNGTGVNRPLGFANSGAILEQAKVSGQTADTIVAGNVTAMQSRMPAHLNASAVWLISQDALPQLPLMTIGDQPVYVTNVNDAPFGLLLGRPVIPVPQCQTLGDAGDLYYVALSEYMAIIKSGGINAAASMHLWFDQDLTAFRFTFRIGGQPWQAAPITPPNSAVTQSPFIRLAARA